MPIKHEEITRTRMKNFIKSIKNDYQFKEFTKGLLSLDEHIIADRTKNIYYYEEPIDKVNFSSKGKEGCPSFLHFSTKPLSKQDMLGFKQIINDTTKCSNYNSSQPITYRLFINTTVTKYEKQINKLIKSNVNLEVKIYDIDWFVGEALKSESKTFVESYINKYGFDNWDRIRDVLSGNMMLTTFFFSALILALLIIVFYTFIEILVYVPTPNDKTFLYWSFCISLALLLIVNYLKFAINSLRPEEKRNKIDVFYIILSSSLLFGFAIYLVVLRLRPDTLFSTDPHDSWWSALGIFVAVIIANWAILMYLKNDISKLEAKINTQDETINKISEILKLNKPNYFINQIESQKNLINNSLKQISNVISFITNSYNIEVGSLDESIKDIDEDINKIINSITNYQKEFLIEYANCIIQFTILIWRATPPRLNCKNDSSLKHYTKICELRGKALRIINSLSKQLLQDEFIIEQNNFIIYDCFSQIELDIEKDRKIESTLNGIIESPLLYSYKSEIRTAINEQIVIAKSLMVKHYMRTKKFNEALTFISEIMEHRNIKNSKWDNISYLICLLFNNCLCEDAGLNINMQTINVSNKTNGSDIPMPTYYDNEGLRPFWCLIKCFTCRNNTSSFYKAKQQFLQNFYVLNTQFYSSVSTYDRYSFFNFYDNFQKILINDSTREDLLNLYLIYYYCWGDFDKGADAELNNGDKLQELEVYLMNGTYPHIGSGKKNKTAKVKK